MKCTKWKQGIRLLLMTVLVSVGVTGCKETTEEDILADMKEYTSESESVSIYLDEDWVTEELGFDTWLGAKSKSGNNLVMVAQLPKKDYNGIITSLEDVKDMMGDTFKITDLEPIEAPDMPVLSEPTAFTCKMSAGGASGEGYLIYGESEYAYYMLGYIANSLSDKKINCFDVSCSTLKEIPQEEENRFSAEMTDTIRWFNASYAILTKLNNWDTQYFGGMAANDMNAMVAQKLLQDSWSVTDRASADENMNWILSEGHRKEFKGLMQDLTSAGIQDVEQDGRKAFMLENFDVTDEQAQYYVDMYAYYEQYGETAIHAWDYCRALSLAAYYYLAGYYTEQEALDKSLEIAQQLQPLYASWDEAMDSYLCGYEYWSEESSEERRAVYEELKGQSNSPYSVDWNIAFERNW